MSLAGKLMRYGVDALPHVQYVLKKSLEFVGSLELPMLKEAGAA
jgi:hypothetical protein